MTSDLPARAENAPLNSMGTRAHRPEMTTRDSFDPQPLIAALRSFLRSCRHGALDAVRRYIETGSFPEDEGHALHSVPVLSLADDQVIRSLLEMHEENGRIIPTIRNGYGMRAAAACGHLALVRYFLEECPEDEQIRRPLFVNESLCHAAQSGHLDCIRYILERCPLRIHVNPTYRENRPLRWANTGNHVKTVRYLALFVYGIHMNDESVRPADLERCLKRRPEEIEPVRAARYRLIALLEKEEVPPEKWPRAFRRFLGNADSRRCLSTLPFESLSYADLRRQYAEGIKRERQQKACRHRRI